MLNKLAVETSKTKKLSDLIRTQEQERVEQETPCILIPQLLRVSLLRFKAIAGTQKDTFKWLMHFSIGAIMTHERAYPDGYVILLGQTHSLIG